MKQIVVVVGLWLLFVRCSSDSTQDGPTTETTASEETTASPNSERNGDVMLQMPDGDQIDEGYKAILEKAGVDDPELLELYVNFSKSSIEREKDRADLSLKLVSPTDKNKIVSYRYDFQNKEVEGPQEVTLSTGIGSREAFIDTYDGFKNSLFRKQAIVDFDQAGDIYQAAIAKSGYKPEDCYVNQLQFMYFPNGLRGSVAVQSTRSPSAHKSFSVDKEGNLTAY
ncbi:hypothetical protein GCM10027341_12890 [Spirosoma knui]